MPVKIALPKGRLLKDTALLTARSGWDLSDYSEGARLYHLTSGRFPDLTAKIFHEKDIPIQVAMGNYDLGVCGLDWIQELMVKYPGSELVKIKNLEYGGISLYLAASESSPLTLPGAIHNTERSVDIASEYPNLAESLALKCRCKYFNVFPVWGAAEIYPPENADLVLLSTLQGAELSACGLSPIMKVLNSSAYLIANKTAWETRDLSGILNSLEVSSPVIQGSQPDQPQKTARRPYRPENGRPTEEVRLALPDGHAQKHVVNILEKAGIPISDYPSTSGNRRPRIGLKGVCAKVVRPQDMPLQVANNKFDIAITGKDWVLEHLYQFPSSPAVEMVDLKYSRVKIVAAVHNDLPVDNTSALSRLAAQKGLSIRVASEYTCIADKYARDNHLGPYRVIPTWGATEAFLPDDADILIENTETGTTLKRHNLKVIETLFESTACLIASQQALFSDKAVKINSIAAMLKKAVED
ncbi:MAG: ATP phosphoribosyltransferase [Dehalococcoidales bacterium]|nr:ATP phosphoribosyltransferase [Dehalococcoidales bacterium]